MRYLRRLPTFIELAIAYVFFACFFTVTSFENALQEAVHRLSKIGLGKVLSKILASFQVDKKMTIRQALKHVEYQPLVMAYLDEMNGVTRSETIRGLECTIVHLLDRCRDRIDLFLGISQLVLLISLMSLILPMLGSFLGYSKVIALSYILQVASIALIYLFQLGGIVLPDLTLFPTITYLLLLVSLIIGAVTYILTGSIGISCIVIGIFSIVLTFRDYLKHLETLKSLPVRVRFSFSSLLSPTPYYYPPKIDNIIDRIFEELFQAARGIGNVDTISLTYRLADKLLGTYLNLRSSLRFLGILFLGLTISIVGVLHWMTTSLTSIAISGTYMFHISKQSIEAINKLLALSLAVTTFIAGKLLDNEHLGMYLQALAGVVILTVLHA